MKSKGISRGSKSLFLAAGFVLLIQFVMSSSASLAELLYGKALYPIVRGLLDKISWPVSGIYLLLLGVLFYLIFLVVRLLRSSETRRDQWKKCGLSIAKLLAVLICWFYLLWGYNYNRPDLLERMEVKAVEPDTAWIFSELVATIDRANELRRLPELAHLDSLKYSDVLSHDLDVDHINQELENVLPKFRYDLKVDPTFRFLEPDGALLHWSTAGIYWPFSGESNVDRGVHYIKKPVTIAHELAHAHGLTSEGDCNFIAFLACVQSSDPLLQYSGQISYLGYLMRDALKILGREGLERYYNQMSTELQQDRENIYNHHNQYKDYFPKLRNKVYDSYLRSQGVKGGIGSYNYFVKLKYTFDLSTHCK